MASFFLHRFKSIFLYMNIKKKLRRYIQSIDYLTRTEGIDEYDVTVTDGEVGVFVVDHVKRIDKTLQPPHIGNNVNILI